MCAGVGEVRDRVEAHLEQVRDRGAGGRPPAVDLDRLVRAKPRAGPFPVPARVPVAGWRAVQVTEDHGVATVAGAVPVEQTDAFKPKLRGTGMQMLQDDGEPVPGLADLDHGQVSGVGIVRLAEAVVPAVQPNSGGIEEERWRDRATIAPAHRPHVGAPEHARQHGGGVQKARVPLVSILLGLAEPEIGGRRAQLCGDSFEAVEVVAAGGDHRPAPQVQQSHPHVRRHFFRDDVVRLWPPMTDHFISCQPAARRRGGPAAVGRGRISSRLCVRSECFLVSEAPESPPGPA